MATKPGVLRRVASKTVAAGRRHVAKVLKGEETVAEAAGGTVEDLRSGPKAKSAPRPAVKKRKASLKTATKKRSASKRSTTQKTRKKPTAKTS
jgi:hypothetical protein